MIYSDLFDAKQLWPLGILMTLGYGGQQPWESTIANEELRSRPRQYQQGNRDWCGENSDVFLNQMNALWTSSTREALPLASLDPSRERGVSFCAVNALVTRDGFVEVQDHAADLGECCLGGFVVCVDLEHSGSQRFVGFVRMV